MTRIFNLTTVSQTGTTATSQFEGVLTAKKRLREAQQDRSLRYLLVVEVLDDGGTEVYDELWIPPDGAVANGSGIQAVVRDQCWDIRSEQFGGWIFPAGVSPLALVGELLSYTKRYATDHWQQGEARGRADQQHLIREALGIRNS